MNTGTSESSNGRFNRDWSFLNWNIRGINSVDKCNAVKEKIEESACSIFCIQETKRSHFDHSYIKKLAPPNPRVEHYGFIISKIERRLTATSNLLTHAGRLQLVNTVLSSFPAYAMCTLQIPVAVLECIDRARRHCL